ncbi:MAG: hypothetical protein P8166_02560 [Candidatus Thiodiazotropha sp.]
MRESSQDPRAQIILDRLRDACQNQLAPGAVKRTVWRAGELRLPDAASLIEQLAGQNDNLLDYCVAWSLGRCGDARNLPVLARLEQKYGESFVGAMVREAQLALLDPQGREALLKRISNDLPGDLGHLIEKGQTPEILGALESLVRHPSIQTVDLLVDCYGLTLKYESLGQALLQLLPTLKPVPNRFKAIRRLFKAAEFREDAPTYGRIVHLLDSNASYYRAPDFGETVYDPVSQRRLKPSDEFRKSSPALAYSNRTRDYLRRRSWRTLRRFADDSPEHYIAFSVEILLCVTDADARPEQVISFYDYDNGNYVSRTFDRFSHLFAFNQILNRHNPRIKRSGSGMHWLKDAAVEEIATLRCEAYATLWDHAPQALLRLLTESRCEDVHRFALRALKCNQAFVDEIGAEPVCSMLAMPYEETARFALEIAQKLVRSGQADTSLIRALLGASLQDARLLAQETLCLNPQLISGDVDLIYTAIISPYEDNRLWMRRFCADHPPAEEKVTVLVVRLIAGAIALGRESDEPGTLIDDIGWMLINIFGATTRVLGFDVITDLLIETSVAVQLLGARLLLNHATAVEEQPPALLRQLLEAKSAEVRALGTQLFGQLSDEALLAQPTLTLKLALSHEAQVRQAAQPVIHRLVQADRDFAAFALERLIESLFRGEPSEGFHEDILRLVKQGLETASESLDAATTWRLLQARSKGAQRYGAHLLGRWSYSDFSIRQLGRLAGNPILSVRQWAWKGYEQQLAQIKTQARDALVIFDAPWEDTRHFAQDFFDRHFEADDWHPELLVAICDSTLDDVQDYGRQLIMRFFDEQQGVNYLLKLSQHPSNKVQLFVSQFLHQYAADNLEHLQQLRYYFLSVLAKVNQGRAAKTRIIDFLRDEALKSPQASEFVLEIFSRHSVTSALVDKSACIEMLLLIQQHYPQLDSPLKTVETRVHPLGEVG